MGLSLGTGRADAALQAQEGGISGPAKRWRTLLLRPELTAIVGTIAVFIFFAVTAGSDGFLTSGGTINYLQVSAEIGIIAVPVTLLLIAGEFDLSVGSVVGTSAMLMAYLIIDKRWPLALAFPIGLIFGAAVGCANGFLTVRTRIPSFLVTLATSYILAGAGIALSNSIVGTTQIYGLSEALKGDPLLRAFTGTLLGLPVEIWWWFGITLVGTYVLVFTPFGNWVYACGGNRESARNTGVPVRRVKVVLFTWTAMASCIVGLLSSFTTDGADVTNGADKMFQAPVAAVIGGALLTGGYGSVIGTAFGALLFGMVSQGFFYTSIDGNWFEAFLGGMMLIAIFVNDHVRRLSLRQRRPT